jgi:membrane-bound lytic murein transglycosylase B
MRKAFTTTLLLLLFLSTMVLAKGKIHSPHPHRFIDSGTGPRFGLTPALKELAQDLANEGHLPTPWVMQTLTQAHRLNQIKPLLLPAGSGFKKNWTVYRQRFVNPSRIEAGVAFSVRNRENLLRIQTQYGVPWNIVVAILGVETFYAKEMGRFQALDVLTTLALEFPKEHPKAAQRQAFFKSELLALLLLMQEHPKMQWKSSYAGAMGQAQFMPSNWSKYGVDFDQDGKIDLFQSELDAMASVANYLASFGWISGMPTHFEWSQNTSEIDHFQELLLNDILPTLSAEQLIDHKVKLNNQALNHTDKFAVIELENGEQEPTYLLGTNNFYVITRYNWSSYYAMAVIELGQAIKAASLNKSEP